MQYIISTTLQATALRKVVKYWDVNPPTTESSKRKQPCWGENTVGEDCEVLINALLGEQPQQQNLEKEDTTMPGIWTNVLPCWKIRHPWESTEKFLSILSSLWMFTLFKNNFVKNFVYFENNDTLSIKTCKTFVELKQIRVQIIGWKAQIDVMEW